MKEIILTKGQVALVDDDDYEWLSQIKWCAHKDKNTFYGQAQRKIGNKRAHLSMHREILKRHLGKNFKENLLTDHIDHNGLNNQKSNLRQVTNRENQMNKRDEPFVQSIYFGVHVMDERYKSKKYRARVHLNGKKYHLGCFEDELKAAIVCMQFLHGPNYLYE